VNTEAASLVFFLENGFPDNLANGLPPKPLMKSEIVDAAIRELGGRAAPEGVPILQRIVRRDLPQSIERIIRRDFEAVPIEMLDEYLLRMRRVLSLNAIVALGEIGDPESAATILGVMRSETSTGFTTKGAIALGQMGRNDGIPAVAILASDPESGDSVAAFDALFHLTGRNYGYTDFTALGRRGEIVALMKQWLETEGKDFPVNRMDVKRRLASGVPLLPVDPESLRGLLRASADAASYDNRWTAREQLRATSKGSFDELKAIVEDTREDLDIRRAAMSWLAAADPKEAISILRRQEKDRNPQISAFALSLKADIKDAIAYEKNQK